MVTKKYTYGHTKTQYRRRARAHKQTNRHKNTDIHKHTRTKQINTRRVRALYLRPMITLSLEFMQWPFGNQNGTGSGFEESLLLELRHLGARVPCGVCGWLLCKSPKQNVTFLPSSIVKQKRPGLEKNQNIDKNLQLPHPRPHHGSVAGSSLQPQRGATPTPPPPSYSQKTPTRII